MRNGKKKVHGKSVGTSLSNALIMITVTVINICKNKRRK